MGQHVAGPPVPLAGDAGPEAQRFLVQAAFNRLFNALKRAAADKEDIGRINLHIFLLRMLASALRRDIGDRAFEYLEQSLLDTLPGHVAGDAGAFGLAGDLVNLVNVDDAALGVLDDGLDVLAVVGGLQQLQQDILDIFADIAGLGQRRGIGDGEGDIEDFGECLRQQCLAASRRAEQQDVALLQLDIGVLDIDALEVIVDGYGEGALGLLLADHILGQNPIDLFGLGDSADTGEVLDLRDIAADDLIAQVDAFQADAAVDS